MKKKTLYKLLTSLTLLLPISLFLIISAITGQTYDAEIYIENDAVIEFNAYDDGYIVYSVKASYTGYIVPYNEEYGIYIEEDDILKVGNEFFTPYFNEDTQAVELTNFDDIPVAPQANSRWFVSIASIVALGIVGLIIGGKMDLLKKRPRLSALVTLVVLTAILYGLNTIIGDMLNVFIIATASWLAYCLEYAVNNGIVSLNKSDETQAKILSGLKGLLNEWYQQRRK